MFPRLPLLALLLAISCDNSSTSTEVPALVDIVTTTPDGHLLEGAVACQVTTARDSDPDGNRDHRDECSDLTYDTVPPNSGPHYRVWADFKIYDAPVPWPYMVHSMEHGAVVIAYKCTTDCAYVTQTLRAFYDAYTADSLCSTTDARHRLIVVPDPTLDVPLAIASWGYIYKATCFDEPSFRAFIDAHYGNGVEHLCNPGIDHTSSGWCAQQWAGDAGVGDAGQQVTDANVSDSR